MKQYTSSFFKSIALTLMGFPVIYVVLVATSFDIPLTGCMRILLAPIYYLVTGVAVIVGYGLWEMQRWSWYGFLVFQGLLLYENAIIGSEYAESHHRAFVFIASVLMQIIIGMRVAREIRVPYFFPKIRWWESNPRYRVSIPVSIQKENGELILAEILDLSNSGCFIKLRPSLEISQKIKLNFRAYSQILSLSGTVVWDAMSTVTHPKGVGVIFEYPPRDQRKSLRFVYSRLRRVSSHYRRFRYWMEPAEFDKILLELESDTPVRPKFVSIGRSNKSEKVIQTRIGKN